MRKIGKRHSGREKGVGKVGRPKKYEGGSVRISLRMEAGLAKRLKLLHLYDQSKVSVGNGSVSRDVWIQSILQGYVDGRVEDIRMLVGYYGEVREDV